MPKSIRQVFVLCLVACGLLSTNTSAAQAAQPRISFGISHPYVNAGQHPVFFYSVKKAKKSAKVYLQRKAGSRGAWVSVARLRVRSGRVTAPAVGIGAYLYRVAVYTKRKHHKTKVSVSAIHGVRAYGTISLNKLCLHSDSASRCDGGGGGFGGRGSQAVGNRVFSYQFSLVSGGSGGYFDTTFERSTCRSMNFLFASSGQYENQAITVAVIQQTRDVVRATAPTGTVKRIVTRLDGRPLVMRISDNTFLGDAAVMAGTASCYTASGQ